MLKLVPDDAETHYTIGVIDWMQAYKFSVDALLSDGLRDDGLGNAHMSPATCENIKTHNAQLVDDATSHLTRAIELNPNYSDARFIPTHAAMRLRHEWGTRASITKGLGLNCELTGRGPRRRKSGTRHSLRLPGRSS